MRPTPGENRETPSVPKTGHLVPAIVQSIRRDHRNMEQLLSILEQELAIFRRGERPDFDILSGIVEYFRFHPDRCHRPKEALVLATLKEAALKEQVPDRTSALLDDEAEGRQAQASLETFTGLIEDVINEQEVSREAVVAAAKDFAAHVKRLIRFAEGELLPTALQSLTSQAWAALDEKLANRNDPIVDPVMEARFGELAERLGKWEREDQAERARFSQGR